MANLSPNIVVAILFAGVVVVLGAITLSFTGHVQF